MRISDIFSLGYDGDHDHDHRHGARRGGLSYRVRSRSSGSFIQIGILGGGLSLPVTGDGSLGGAGRAATCSMLGQPSPAAATTTSFAAPVGVLVANPTQVSIPAIGADSTLIPLGLNPDGTMQVPSVHTPGQAGWYARGVKPGDVGPAVVVGHCDGDGQLGVFHLLREIAIGDDVHIGGSDGATLTFRVTQIEQMPKGSGVGTRRLNEAKVVKVYGDLDHPALRVITCGGRFVGGELGYADNIVVFADLL